MSDATADVTEVFEEIVATEPERKIRNSYKYRIKPSTTFLMSDVVYANDPLEAEAKGRERYEIPADETVEVVRLSEPDNVEMRLN